MIRFFPSLLVLIAVIANGAASPEIEEPLVEKKVQPGLTVEQFDGYVNLLQMFKDMLPKELINTVENLNGGEKGELVALITNWFQGNVKKPENREEVAQFLKDNLPSVSAKIEKLNSTFYEKFDKLKPKTQEMLRLWRDKAVNLGGSTTGEAASRQLQVYIRFAYAKDVALTIVPASWDYGASSTPSTFPFLSFLLNTVKWVDEHLIVLKLRKRILKTDDSLKDY